MDKLDLKKELKEFYAPSAKKFSVVEVPTANFLMIDGQGDPATSVEYSDAINALYSIAYTLKFTLKFAGKTPDFTVMPLEALWWADDYAVFNAAAGEAGRSEWKWTNMIMQPDFVTADMIEQAKVDALKKKGELPSLEKVRFETFTEGLSAQILYIGPWADEAPTIAALHEFIAEQNGELSGKHHEIYLSDPRRTAPEKLKTIIRQPFAKAK